MTTEKDNLIDELLQKIAHLKATISNLVAPSGMKISEPGTYELNTTLYPDDSGFSRTWTKANPEHDCYPPLSWVSAKIREAEILKLSNKNAALVKLRDAVQDLVSMQDYCECGTQTLCQFCVIKSLLVDCAEGI